MIKLNISFNEIKLIILFELAKEVTSMTILKNNLQNMKKTWEALNNLLNRKTKKSRHVNAIKDFNNGNKIKRNPQRIANILNEHFASVGEKPFLSAEPLSLICNRPAALDAMENTNFFIG